MTNITKSRVPEAVHGLHFGEGKSLSEIVIEREFKRIEHTKKLLQPVFNKIFQSWIVNVYWREECRYMWE